MDVGAARVVVGMRVEEADDRNSRRQRFGLHHLRTVRVAASRAEDERARSVSGDCLREPIGKGASALDEVEIIPADA